MADGKIIIETDIDQSGAEKGVSKLQGTLGKIGSTGAVIGKTVAAGVGAATAALGVLVKSSVEQYATYEQAVGGIETLDRKSVV